MSRKLQMIRRYAKALLAAAAAAGEVDTVRSDLAAVRSWVDGAPAFHVFMECEHLGGREARVRAVLELARSAGLGPLTTEFLARLGAAQDLALLAAIHDEFERQGRERMGIVRGEIVSARPLPEAQKAELARRFGGPPDQKLELTFREDARLIGGFVARIGERIHDCSISGRLARLRRRLAEA